MPNSLQRELPNHELARMSADFGATLLCVSLVVEPFGRSVAPGLDAKIAMSSGKEHNELLCRSVEGENK